jgi:7-cyano-7-deazaguanine synthase
MSEDSSGDEAETEAPLAYVPYRNTLFATMLGALADEKIENSELVEFLFGMNLTEMGVYVDNTNAWLESVRAMITYGGKKYKETIVSAPFINFTKTNMLKFIIEKFGVGKAMSLMNIAFSCYYPDENGEPCGKCGSCILRQKAWERAINSIGKGKANDRN